MKTNINAIRNELAEIARKTYEDRLTSASSGNISAREGKYIYIKISKRSFEKAKPSDFVKLNIDNPCAKRLKLHPSCEYKFHIACYNKRQDIKAVIHTHPLFITTLYSAGVRFKPVTIEFAVYIGVNGVTVIDFALPGTKELADRVAQAAKDHDVILLKKHGLITIGKTLQEAYLKSLVIEREAKAQVLSRFFKKGPAFLTRQEIYELVNSYY